MREDRIVELCVWGAAVLEGEEMSGDSGRVDGWSAPSDPASSEERPVADIGPQVASDPPFVARMRLAQSKWRAEVLRVPPGTGPYRSSERVLGSMLTSTHADMGLNFLTRSAWKAAEDRIAAGSGVEAFRCRANLLSSQPMAFNLFGPLVAELDVATQLLAAVLPGGVSEVTSVKIEYAPEPASEYLNDRTAYDAFIEYIDGDGERAFVGVETKLSEPFSQKRYEYVDLDEKPNRYRVVTEAEGSPWLELVPELTEPKWNQLWRNQMLVEATRTHADNPHGRRGALAVVHHADDPNISEAIAGYRQLLREPDSLLVWSLDGLVDSMRAEASDERVRSWLDRFVERYGGQREGH